LLLENNQFSKPQDLKKLPDLSALKVKDSVLLSKVDLALKQTKITLDFLKKTPGYKRHTFEP